MNNRSHKAGRIIAALALAVASTVAAVSSSSAAGLPSVRLVSPTFDATNSVDATGDIAKELVAGRDKAFFDRQGNLTVSFAGDSQAIAGVYSDVVNLVIKAK